MLSDDGASKVVDSYELNAPRAPEEDEEDEEGPATEPTPEPEDPTEPVQPNQPIESPNTGTYLSIIGILWLLMFAFVFIYCRKTMFKKI